MTPTFTPLAPADQADLDCTRAWVAGHLSEAEQGQFDDRGTKLNIVTVILNDGLVAPEEALEMRAG